MITLPNLDLDIAPCNYRCAACNHFAPLGHIPLMAPAQITHDLGALVPFLRAEKISVLGGEPTLHPALLEVLAAIRQSGITPKIVVLTNGSRLEHMPEAFWTAFDALYVSLYPDERTQRSLPLARAMQAKYGFELGLIPIEFSKVLSAEVRSPSEMAALYQACPFRVYCRAVYHGYLYQCFPAHVLPEHILGLPATVDGLRLDETLTEAKLHTYLNQPGPLESCARCAYRREFIAWHETENWLRDSTETL